MQANAAFTEIGAKTERLLWKNPLWRFLTCELLLPDVYRKTACAATYAAAAVGKEGLVDSTSACVPEEPE